MDLFLRLVKRIVFMFARLFLRIKNPKQCLSDPSIWGLSVNERDHLVIGGCDCDELAKEYGTPLHVINQNKLISNLRNFYDSLRIYGEEIRIFYSYKTNPVPGVLSILHQQGAGAEVISPYELWLAFKLGVPPERIIYNGPCKSDESLKIAIDKQIKLINIDSFDEIDRISAIAKKLGKVAQVGIRVCSDVGWSHQLGLKINTQEAFQAYKRCAANSSLKICAVHVHLGTCLKDSHLYTESVDTIFKFIKEINDKLRIEIEYLDLGGGFAVPTVQHFSKFKSRFYKWGGYGSPVPNLEDCSPVEAFVKNIVEHINDRCKQFNLKKPILFLEPGRAITSNAQSLLIKVTSIKHEQERTKVIIADGGINIAYPATWEYHEIFLANRMSQKREEFYSISGPICTPADKIYSYKLLPHIQKGDILAIMDAGAYFIPFSNNFSFPRPAIVNTFQGKHYLLRQRESFEDIARIS